MRRLPIFFVIDVSESMIGEMMEKVQEGLESIITTLRQDPHALETVYISVIAFAGKARTLTPLVSLEQFYPPKLPVGGGTALGEALMHTMNEMDRQVKKGTSDNKGDWKPIVFLFTDGKPTEDMTAALNGWNKWKGRSLLVAVTFGRSADFRVLNGLTEEVLILEDPGEKSFKDFVRWVTASISLQSKSLNPETAGLAPLSGVNLEKASAATTALDEKVVILTGRCQKNTKPFLVKYHRTVSDELPSMGLHLEFFELEGAFSVTEDYFAMSGDKYVPSTVASDKLQGVPSCPQCGAATAGIVCGCGGIFCANSPGMVTCPWCKSSGELGMPNENESNVNLRRGQG